MKGLYLLITLLLAGKLSAQENGQTNDSLGQNADSATLVEAFRNGKVQGHARYFFMTTHNRDELSDYYAHAVGGGLKYESAPFKGLQAGVSGFFIYNIGSSDLSKADPYSGQYNRYEIGLFDVEDPRNKSNLQRLEELYVKYSRGKGTITFGKQLINTPFINPQDGRMRPTVVEGLYGSVQLHEKLRMEGGWVYKVSPRSTVRWYSVARSIGVNGQGVNRDGSRGNYAGNVQSRGVGLLGFTYKPSAGVQLKAFEQLSENVFHTALLQADLEKKAGVQKWIGALQYIRQDAINNGGNADPAKAYFARGNKVNILGGRAGWQKGRWETTLNYTRIFKGGRFTIPREWGMEPLFTALPRERNEGAGDVNAVMVQAKSKLLHERLKLEVGYGHFYMPAYDNAALNKYSMPSYQHVKLLGNYTFNRALKGADLGVLVVYKDQLGTYCKEDRYLINKVDMLSFNLVVNYSF